MLQLKGEKMSKSLGNLVTIDEFLAEHGADVLRLVIAGSGYRKPLVFNEDVIADGERGAGAAALGAAPCLGPGDRRPGGGNAGRPGDAGAARL